VSIPITSRLDDATVRALDEAVAAGSASSRAALIAAAVAEWLERHDEQAILDSYRRAYAEPDPEHETLMDAFAVASMEAILAGDEEDAPR
jgi:Arc/MetJ-type ribon-helix-helix transcriptional regulator